MPSTIVNALFVVTTITELPWKQSLPVTSAKHEVWIRNLFLLVSRFPCIYRHSLFRSPFEKKTFNPAYTNKKLYLLHFCFSPNIGEDTERIQMECELETRRRESCQGQQSLGMLRKPGQAWKSSSTAILPSSFIFGSQMQEVITMPLLIKCLVSAYLHQCFSHSWTTQ